MPFSLEGWTRALAAPSRFRSACWHPPVVIRANGSLRSGRAGRTCVLLSWLLSPSTLMTFSGLNRKRTRR